MICKILMALCITLTSYADSCVETTIEKPKYYNRTMVTIGDSITYSDYGEFLRCMLDNQGIGYDFIGSKIDKFGFFFNSPLCKR